MYYHEKINLNNNDQCRILKFSTPKQIFAQTFKSWGCIYDLFYKALSIFIGVSLFFLNSRRERLVLWSIYVPGASTSSWSFHEKPWRGQFDQCHIFLWARNVQGHTSEEVCTQERFQWLCFKLMELYFPPRLSLHFKWVFKPQKGAKHEFQITLPGSEDRDF